MSWIEALKAAGVIGPLLLAGWKLLKRWHDSEPLARSLQQRERLHEQARNLDGIGEYDWARRRYHDGEMAVATRLSRFEMYRERRLWSVIVVIVPVLWAVGFLIVGLALLMGLSGEWQRVFWVGSLINLTFGLSLLVIVPVHGYWFDGRVRLRAQRRVVEGGRARPARRERRGPALT